MTVAELIEQLQKLPQMMPVVVNLGRSELANGCCVHTVEVVDAQERPEDTGRYVDGWMVDAECVPILAVANVRH